MKQKSLLLLALFFYVPVLMAAEIRQLGQDYRSLAMGNTGIVTANSSAALFYNPATMANISTWWIDLPMMQLIYSDDTKALVDQAKTGSFNLSTQTEQIDFMKSFVGKNPYVRFDLGVNWFINFDKKGFTAGGNYTYEALLDIAVRNPTMPEISLKSGLDHVRQVGVSVPLGLGKWILGITRKQVERQSLDFTYSMADAIDKKPFPTMAANGLKGRGTGYDLGLLYRAPSAARLMYGFVYRQKIKLGANQEIPEEVAFGVASVQSFGIGKWTGAVDWRDLTFKNASLGDKSINRRTHVGTELSLIPFSENSNLLSLRAGYSQGHVSKGAEISLGKVMVFGYTKYAEETGEYAGQNPSNRTVLYFSMGF